MNIKKYVAPSAQAAVRLVKSEMGEEAVILRTRTLPPLKKGRKDQEKRVEVTAAIDYEPKSENDSAPNPLHLDELLHRWQIMETTLKDLRETLLSANAGVTLKPEIYYNETLRDRYINYLSFGLKSEIIDQLMRDFKMGVGGGSHSPGGALRESLSKVLAKIATHPVSKENRGRKILSFVGPTGVGKTTTLAKLAAINAVRQGRKTVLITLDTFRVAAVAQLESYARIMGVPLEVAVNRLELQKAIAKHSDSDLILIDTAGRSPNHKEAIRELREILDLPEDIHGYLVLSATEEYKNLLHADESFAALPFKSYIFTKLDEIQNASSMINFLIARDKPVSYFAAGQQVPEDIEAASKKKLASLILAGMYGTAGNSINEVNEYGSSDRT